MNNFQRQLRSPLKRITLPERNRVAYLWDNFPTDFCWYRNRKASIVVRFVFPWGRILYVHIFGEQIELTVHHNIGIRQVASVCLGEWSESTTYSKPWHSTEAQNHTTCWFCFVWTNMRYHFYRTEWILSWKQPSFLQSLCLLKGSRAGQCQFCFISTRKLKVSYKWKALRSRIWKTSNSGLT